MISVFIVAPTPALRMGLRTLLRGEGVDIVGEAAVAPPTTIEADLLILADADPVQTLPILTLNPGTAMVLLSIDPRLPTLLQRMPLHGWAMVPPDAESEELRVAMFAAAQGFVVLPHQMADQLTPHRGHAQPDADLLTPRELEVLTLLSHGLTNRQLALRLQISEHTIKFHIAAIFTKLGATSRTEAVSIGVRRGLIGV